MKRLIFVVFSTFLCLATFGQDFENYTPLKAEAPIPNAILTSSTEKYQTIKQDVAQQKIKRREKKASLEFYLKNSFVLDDLLSSNRILFNTHLNDYLDKIKDELLRPLDNSAKDAIKIYVVKASSINAFATDRGEIFVNIGLLANVQNEAELAFVLCHEFQHYLKKHNLNTYIEFDKINKDKGQFRRTAYYDKLLAKHSYSRDLETEADELGLELYKKSKYSLQSAKRVMKLLELAHVPYANVPFNYHLLEVGGIDLSSYKLDSVPEIAVIEDEEEELSTHPSAKDRAKLIAEHIVIEEEDGRTQFIIGEKAFENVQKTARFEMCYILLTNGAYEAAIYHTHLLLKDYPNNLFLKKTMAQSLYGIGKYNIFKKYELPDKDYIQGDMYAVYHLFEKLTHREIGAIAARYVWDLAKEYPDERFINILRDDIIEDIAMENADFYNIFDLTKDSAPSEEELSTTIESVIFKDILQDTTFKKLVDKGFEYAKKREERKDKKGDLKRKKEDRRGVSLGVDNAIFVTPYFIKGKVNRRKSKIDLTGSEISQIGIKGDIEKAGKRLDMTTHILDVNNMNDATTIQEYNSLQTINAWTGAFLDSEIFIYNPYTEEMFDVLKEYKTGTIAYFAGYSVKVPRQWTWLDLYRVALTYSPLLAPSNADLLFPRHESASAMLVLDFYDQRVIMSQLNTSKVKLSKGNINSQLYWMMHQMKRKKKK